MQLTIGGSSPFSLRRRRGCGARCWWLQSRGMARTACSSELRWGELEPMVVWQAKVGLQASNRNAHGPMS